MNTFEIKENAKIELHPSHKGANSNSSSVAYYYYAFAKYALEKYLNGASLDNVYWGNGRQKWTLPQLNLVSNYMGIDKFFLSLRNNTGGATFKYDQIILQAISPLGGNGNLMAYPPMESLEFLHSIGYRNNNLHSAPVFQKTGEEGYYQISITSEGVSEVWVEYTAEDYEEQECI